MAALDLVESQEVVLIFRSIVMLAGVLLAGVSVCTKGGYAPFREPQRRSSLATRSQLPEGAIKIQLPSFNKKVGY